MGEAARAAQDWLLCIISAGSGVQGLSLSGLTPGSGVIRAGDSGPECESPIKERVWVRAPDWPLRLRKVHSRVICSL